MLLTLSIFLPMAGAVAVLLCPKEAKGLIRAVALLTTVASFAPIALVAVDYSKNRGETAPESLERLANDVVAKIESSEARAEVEALLIDPVSSSPSRLSLGQKESLKKRGVYDLWHEAWELKTAAKAATAKEMRYVEYGRWIDAFNIRYFLAVDGLALVMLLLNTLLCILCVYYSFSIEKGVKAYMALFLLLEGGVNGVFCSLDFFLFYVFWEVVLLPMYFLIGFWGGPKRVYAAIKFFIYTLVGSVLMLVAMLALYFHGGQESFNVLTLTAMSPTFDMEFQKWIFIGLFVGFAIKVPVFPFHTWLPDAHVQAPTAVSMMLAGILLKMGGYGFFRFSYPMAPEIARSETLVMFIGILGLINLVYGALCAMAQKDFKSLVAYSSVSHMGYVLLGLAAMTNGGFQGAALQMLNHGISSAMMFLLVGVVYERAHHRDLDRFGGMGLQMPYYTGFAIVGFFASLGLPGLNGFVSEFLCFQGAFQSADFWSGSSVVYGLPRWVVYAALPGVVLTAGYILWTVQRVFLGEVKDPHYKEFKDLTFRETAILIPLALGCIWFGVAPGGVIDFMNGSLASLHTMVTTKSGG
jgi:NADH-quinone oxidoreductase subunit M